jgi:hypothetical protein
MKYRLLFPIEQIGVIFHEIPVQTVTFRGITDWAKRIGTRDNAPRKKSAHIAFADRTVAPQSKPASLCQRSPHKSSAIDGNIFLQKSFHIFVSCIKEKYDFSKAGKGGIVIIREEPEDGERRCLPSISPQTPASKSRLRAENLSPLSCNAISPRNAKDNTELVSTAEFIDLS